MSTQIYVISLISAAVIAAVSVVMCYLRGEPGQKAFWRNLAFIFLSAFLIPGLIFYFKRDASPWWLLLAVVALVVAFQRPLSALSWKSVPLTLVGPALQGKGPAKGLKVVHLSDLHLCSPSAVTMEGKLSMDRVLEANKRAFAWACEQQPDLIAVTGDVTDSGDSAEWDVLKSILEQLPPACRANVVVVPGNHDLTITLGDFIGTRDGRALLEYEKRCALFVRHGLSTMPPNAKLWFGDREVPLTELFDSIGQYLTLHEKFPARVRTTSEAPRSVASFFNVFRRRRGWQQIHEWRGRLDYYVPGIVLAPELVAAIEQKQGSSWPTSQTPLVQDLLQELYPLIVFENEKFVVVALNSNTGPAGWIADGALGSLGTRQLGRLELILNQRERDKCVIVLLHHHVGCPDEVRPLVAKPDAALRMLQLQDGTQLLSLLQRHGGNFIVLHGHKHVGYWAKAGTTTVISGASVSYGDKRGAHNCAAYFINEKGEVYLHSHTRISV